MNSWVSFPSGGSEPPHLLIVGANESSGAIWGLEPRPSVKEEDWKHPRRSHDCISGVMKGPVWRRDGVGWHWEEKRLVADPSSQTPKWRHGAATAGSAWDAAKTQQSGLQRHHSRTERIIIVILPQREKSPHDRTASSSALENVTFSNLKAPGRSSRTLRSWSVPTPTSELWASSHLEPTHSSSSWATRPARDCLLSDAAVGLGCVESSWSFCICSSFHINLKLKSHEKALL